MTDEPPRATGVGPGSSFQFFGLFFLTIFVIGRLPRVFFEKSEIGQGTRVFFFDKSEIGLHSDLDLFRFLFFEPASFSPSFFHFFEIGLHSCPI